MEEWNEYGELKENVGTGAAPSISTPSAPSTPSKAPKPADSPSKVSTSTTTPSRPQQSTATDSPLTTAMRQAGLEAAKKAGEAKSQARAKVSGESKASSDALKKLDNSTAAGLPPPTGKTEASSFKALETRSSNTVPHGTTIPETSKTRGKDTLQLRTSKIGGSEASVNSNEDASSQKDEGDEKDSPPQKPATGQSTSKSETSDEADESPGPPATEKVSSQRNTVKPLKEQGKTSGPLPDFRKLNIGKTAATSATTTEAVHRAPTSSAKKTRDQAAGDGEQAGESVGD